MTKNGWRCALLVSVIAALLGTWPGSVCAAGFQLFEQNASGLGHAYAGQAAAAEDASAIYFNPADLTHIPRGQVVGALHLLKPAATFRNHGSCTPYVGTGVGTSTCPFGPHGNLGHVAGGHGGDAGAWSLPDEDRTWLAAGAQWAFTPRAALDFGLAYLFVKGASSTLVNQEMATAVPRGSLVGTYNVTSLSLLLAFCLSSLSKIRMVLALFGFPFFQALLNGPPSSTPHPGYPGPPNGTRTDDRWYPQARGTRPARALAAQP